MLSLYKEARTIHLQLICIAKEFEVSAMSYLVLLEINVWGAVDSRNSDDGGVFECLVLEVGLVLLINVVPMNE